MLNELLPTLFTLFAFWLFKHIFPCVWRGEIPLKKCHRTYVARPTYPLTKLRRVIIKGLKNKNILKNYPLQESKSKWPIETNVNSGPIRIR